MKAYQILMTSTVALVSAAVPSPAQPTYINFDPPNSFATHPAAINSAGAITGYFQDGQSLFHGFVRLTDGTFQIFDVPKAVNGTFPAGINDKGEVSGSWMNQRGITYGFLRKPDGTIIAVVPPKTRGGNLFGINNKGQAAGFFYHGNGHHAYVVKGTKDKAFDVPDGKDLTGASAINNNSDVFGDYVSTTDHALHFFIRDRKKNVTTFDVANHNIAVAISDTGYAVGTTASSTDSSFERAPDGTIQPITPSADAVDTWVTGVIDDGTSAGYYRDTHANTHGFIVSAAGEATIIDDPDASYVTEVWGINASGVIAGSWVDFDGQFHGFLRTP